jgi:SP family myo-inositol transporter-like MFS transporter 13
MKKWMKCSENATFSDLMSDRNTRRALLIGCLLQACQQAAGINTVMYYAATLLMSAGFTANSAIWLSAVLAAFNACGSYGGMRVVDKLGRRPLLLGSLSAVVCALGAIAISFYFAEIRSGELEDLGDDHCSDYKWTLDCVEDSGCGVCSAYQGTVDTDVCVSGSDDGPDDLSDCSKDDFYFESPPDIDQVSSWLVFSFICVYLLCFSPGIGMLPWTINGEIYSMKHRGMANSISTGTNWIVNFMVSMTFLTLYGALTKQGAFGLYAALTAISAVFFYFFLPETLGVALEDTPLLFGDNLWGKRNTGPIDKELQRDLPTSKLLG